MNHDDVRVSWSHLRARNGFHLGLTQSLKKGSVMDRGNNLNVTKLVDKYQSQRMVDKCLPLIKWLLERILKLADKYQALMTNVREMEKYQSHRKVDKYNKEKPEQDSQQDNNDNMNVIKSMKWKPHINYVMLQLTSFKVSNVIMPHRLNIKGLKKSRLVSRLNDEGLTNFVSEPKLPTFISRSVSFCKIVEHRETVSSSQVFGGGNEVFDPLSRRCPTKQSWPRLVAKQQTSSTNNIFIRFLCSSQPSCPWETKRERDRGRPRERWREEINNKGGDKDEHRNGMRLESLIVVDIFLRWNYKSYKISVSYSTHCAACSSRQIFRHLITGLTRVSRSIQGLLGYSARPGHVAAVDWAILIEALTRQQRIGWWSYNDVARAAEVIIIRHALQHIRNLLSARFHAQISNSEAIAVLGEDRNPIWWSHVPLRAMKTQVEAAMATDFTSTSLASPSLLAFFSIGALLGLRMDNLYVYIVWNESVCFSQTDLLVFYARYNISYNNLT
ncbi:hypothetical protein Scep_004609 [Stephania cephalantha]|uniref:Uncharacterized protein n=1 Tax=Stephania cephalantha TaxID=152367 RepID=A0AAP0PWT0_9MAGN